MATATLAWEQFGGNTSSGDGCQPGAECFRRPQSDRKYLGPDSSLVSRCLRGDEAAWEELVRLHTRQVYGLCYRFTSSAPEAQDLTQEVFLRVFRTIKTFRCDGRLLSHLAGAGDA